MMSLYQLAVVSLLCLCSVLARLDWGDPCNINPANYDRITPESYVINFTRECSEGMVEWSYPFGSFQINFVPVNKVPFKICIKASSTNLLNMFSLEDGKRVRVPFPVKGLDLCIHSEDNQVQLVLVPKPGLFYVTFVDFETKLT